MRALKQVHEQDTQSCLEPQQLHARTLQVMQSDPDVIECVQQIGRCRQVPESLQGMGVAPTTTMTASVAASSAAGHGKESLLLLE